MSDEAKQNVTECPHLPENLHERIAVTDEGCWEWRGWRHERGYGRMRRDKKQVYVHRYLYEKMVAPVPEGKEIDHRCANPPCVNPDHMEPVTHSENNARHWKANPKPRLSHCKHGHELTDENRYVRPDNGKHQCKECKRERQRNR